MFGELKKYAFRKKMDNQLRFSTMLLPTSILVACGGSGGGSGTGTSHTGDAGNNVFNNIGFLDRVDGLAGIDTVSIDFSDQTTSVIIESNSSNNSGRWQNIEFIEGTLTPNDDEFYVKNFNFEGTGLTIDGGDGKDLIQLDFSELRHTSTDAKMVIDFGDASKKSYFELLNFAQKGGGNFEYPISISNFEEIQFKAQAGIEIDIKTRQDGDYNDVISGGSRDDNISTFGGNDEVRGKNGNDVIDGGAGEDELYGDNGDDLINGGDGDDEIYGGYGEDIIQAGAGNDEIKGDAGDDTINGGAGVDVAEINNNVVSFDIIRAQNKIEITYVSNGVTETDTLLQVEFIEYNDGNRLDLKDLWTHLDPGDHGEFGHSEANFDAWLASASDYGYGI